MMLSFFEKGSIVEECDHGKLSKSNITQINNSNSSGNLKKHISRQIVFFDIYKFPEQSQRLEMFSARLSEPFWGFETSLIFFRVTY